MSARAQQRVRRAVHVAAVRRQLFEQVIERGACVGGDRDRQARDVVVGAADVEALDLVRGAVLDDGREDGLQVARVDQVALGLDGFGRHGSRCAGATGATGASGAVRFTGARCTVWLTSARCALACAPVAAAPVPEGLGCALRAADAWRRAPSRRAPEIFSVASAGSLLSTSCLVDCSRRSAAIMLPRPASAAPPASARNSRARENHATTIMPRMPKHDVEHDRHDEAEQVRVALVERVADDAGDDARQEHARTR